MGFQTTSEPRVDVNVVATAQGRISYGSTNYKGRVWLLDDQTAVICSSQGKNVVRTIVGSISEASFDRRSKMLRIQSDSGPITVDAKGCGCNLGVAGNAGPVEGRYQVHRVRADWYSSL